MTVQILIGDVREKLAELADESVHCVVTSPPYWGLRDYGVEGQLGLEPTPDEYIETMVAVFREVRRVMRKDATLWLNMGDSYAGSANGRSAADTKMLANDDRTFRDKPFGTAVGGLKPKDLCMMPARLALALQADGWWLRSEIIWAKPNPMPESVTDRPTSAHEKVFLLSKSVRYFYDAEAVRTPYSDVSIARLSQPNFDMQTGEPKDTKTGNRSHRKVLENIKKRDQTPRNDGERWNENDGRGFRTELGANLRNVWHIATQPYPEAHFATFPTALVEPCIKAGCPEGGAVLDPFAGSGTTGLVADRLGRDAILIELNPEYAAMAEKRLHADAGMFAEVAI